jgi:universal stress protein A
MALSFARVLCPTDYSEAANRALEMALRIAQPSNAEIILVHVLHVPQGDMTDEQGRRLKYEEALQRQTDRLGQLQQSALGGYQNCSIEIPIGEPGEKVIALAAARRADLIVTGTRGRSEIAGLLLGSVTDKLVRHAPCPVLVVR